jgi:hypothetical protein
VLPASKNTQEPAAICFAAARARIDPLAEACRRHLAQVAPHRILGDAEFERKFRRQHAAVQPQPLGNHTLALSQQKILHGFTGSKVE